MVAALQHGHDLVLVLREHLREAVSLLHQLLGRLVAAARGVVVHVLRTAHNVRKCLGSLSRSSAGLLLPPVVSLCMVCAQPKV